jgi:(S)-ureidoglycine aminohydrolase
MPQHGLVGSRAVVDRLYAILPPEGIPESVLPGWARTTVRILAAPAMGARFAEYLIDVAQDGGAESALPAGVEGFLYLIAGSVRVDVNGRGHTLGPGGYSYASPGARYTVRALSASRLLLLKKRFQPAESLTPDDVTGEESKVAGEPFLGVEELVLKKLLPDEVRYDMAMNIFTFPPGFSLPMTETHVMEHGLYMLEGQGVYYLGDRWHEVQAGDFIWMGPYCPQSFYATGSSPARYIYYKNVNRDVEL